MYIAARYIQCPIKQITYINSLDCNVSFSFLKIFVYFFLRQGLMDAKLL